MNRFIIYGRGLEVTRKYRLILSQKMGPKSVMDLLRDGRTVQREEKVVPWEKRVCEGKSLP